MSIFQDAERYLASVKAGWTDPTVDPLEMIEALCAAEFESQEGMISDEEHDKALEDLSAMLTGEMWSDEEHQAELDALHEKLDPASYSVARLLLALDSAISRERDAAVDLANLKALANVPARIAPCERMHADPAPTPTTAKRRARGTAKVPAGTLRSAGARETKKTLAPESAFNLAVEELIKEHGGVLASEYKADTTDASGLMPLDVRAYTLNTPAGVVRVTPYGNWIAMRFEDPDAARAWVQWGGLNTYSGKWNHHYDGVEFDTALASARHALEHVTRTNVATTSANGTP